MERLSLGAGSRFQHRAYEVLAAVHRHEQERSGPNKTPQSSRRGGHRAAEVDLVIAKGQRADCVVCVYIK